MFSTKYDNLFMAEEAFSADINRLTNQLWKLIPMREHEENWIAHLEGVILEIAGLKEVITTKDLNFLILISKLEGLRTSETTFEVYRTTVFKAISLLRELRL